MTITLGTIINISTDYTGNPYDHDVVSLTSTLGLVVYFKPSAQDLAARTITISGSSLTSNAEATIHSTLSNFRVVAVTRLTDTSAMVVYGDGGTMYARVLTISGTTVSAETEDSDTENLASGDIDVSTISSTKCICAYINNATDCEARIISISGTTTTIEASTTLDSSAQNTASVAALSATTAVVVWEESVTTNRPKGMVVSISGTSITTNTEKELDTTDSNGGAMSVKFISSTKAVFGYASTSNYRQYILTISGTTITVGAVTTVGTGGVGVDIALLSSMSFLIVTDTDADVHESSISGTTITNEDTDTPSDVTRDNPEIGTIDTTSALMIWEDGANVGRIVHVSIPDPTFTGYDLVLGAGQP